tara:strand:- start:8086 stop:9987 length:1902 start_codon:yes stop_codon:yes gene_type:complete
MPIPFKSILSSVIANATWLDKTIDDEKKGKLGLFKTANTDPDAIADVQQYINDVADSDGTIGETDTNRKIYSSAQIISNGDSRKVAIGKLDAQVKINIDVNDNQDVTLADHETRIGDNETNIQTNADNIQTNQDEIQAIEDSVGSASGIAPLNASTKIDSIYLPSYVDDVEEYADLASFPVTGETGKIYVAIDTNKTYRWSGSVYAEISPSDVNSVNGYTGIVTLDKTDIGLSNVTNDAQLLRSSADFDTFTEKDTANENDIVLIEDSEDSFNKKKVRLENMLGGGNGGGGSFIWELNEEISPLESFAYGISLLDFDYESEMAISALLIVPSSYSGAKQIALENLAFIIDATSGDVLFNCETTLIKTGENINTTTNIHQSGNSEIAVSLANSITRVGALELTDELGLINGVAVEANDILKIILKRNNTAETSSAIVDARLLKYSATINFKYESPIIPPISLTWDIIGTGTFNTTPTTIEKTSGGAAYSAISSNEIINSGDVKVEFTVANWWASGQTFIGLDNLPYVSSDGSGATGSDSIDYGFFLFSTSATPDSVYIYENGSYFSPIPLSINDKLKIEVNGTTGEINYFQDTGSGYVNIHTSALTFSSYPVKLTASIFRQLTFSNIIFSNSLT